MIETKCLICNLESDSKFCGKCSIDIGILTYASNQRKDAMNRVIDRIVNSRK